MFQNILTSLGVGGASIDTVLEANEVAIGERLRGEVRVKGGSSEQDIRGVVVELVTRCLVDAGGDNKTHAEIPVASEKLELGAVGAGEDRALPLEVEIPLWAPLSVGSTSTFLRTRLDVARAIDPRDSDRLRIVPNRTVTAVLEGMGQAGFRLTESEVEFKARRMPPFVQEFDFKPTSFGDFDVDEVELSFRPTAGGVEVLLTVDNRGGFILGGGERSARFSVSEAELGRVDMAGELRRAINSLRR